MGFWDSIKDIWIVVTYFLKSVFPPAAYDQEPSTLDMNAPEPQNSPQANVTPNPDTLLPWVGPENCRHNCRVIADLVGMTLEQKDDFSRTIHCESGWNPNCIHPNIVNGKVSSTDYGIVQVNDFWHIGLGKDFPSVDYVMKNPEACVRWMAKMWMAGEGKLWVCKLKNLNLQYTP